MVCRLSFSALAPTPVVVFSLPAARGPAEAALQTRRQNGDSKSDSGAVSYPTAGSFRLFASTTESLFTSEEVEGLFENGTPDAGLLIVEVHYTYNAVMNLPWTAPLFPMKLRAYTIMPLPAADP